MINELHEGRASRFRTVNPLMPGGNKKVTYLDKPAAESCRFV